MNSEIIMVCNSINNKNIRRGELKILRKFENELYFEFGAEETNIKKRFYNDLDTLRKDYKRVEELKKQEDTPVKSEEKPKIMQNNFMKK